MCLMVYHGRDAVPLVGAELERAAARNPDSMGLMWQHDRAVHTWRSLEDWPQLLDRIRRLETKRRPFAVHFRYATHGAISLDNAHPIIVNPNVALMHNGILFEYGKDPAQSDTRVFSNTILRQLPRQWWRNRAIVSMVEQATSPSKCILMTPDQTVLLNKHLGVWHRGSWWSNTDFQEFRGHVRKVLPEYSQAIPRAYAQGDIDDDAGVE